MWSLHLYNGRNPCDPQSDKISDRTREDKRKLAEHGLAW